MDTTFVDELRIQVTKTSDGLRDYVQVMSADQLTINVVMLADKVVIRDLRDEQPKPRKKPRKKVQRKREV